jgi:hypothetical protein
MPNRGAPGQHVSSIYSEWGATLAFSRITHLTEGQHVSSIISSGAPLSMRQIGRVVVPLVIPNELQNILKCLIRIRQILGNQLPSLLPGLSLSVPTHHKKN